MVALLREIGTKEKQLIPNCNLKASKIGVVVDTSF